MTWNKPRIIAEIQRLHARGTPLSYNAMSERHQSLVSAAAYHFGSYRKAVERAGIEYAEISRRPRWTRQRIIALIKQARRKGEDLHWAAVISRSDDLARAAFAALQPRLFGRWDRALTGAGLDADEISRYRSWNRSSIVFEIKGMAQGEHPLNSGAVQQEDPALHAAAVRYFGSWDKALKAARIKPEQVRIRKRWSKESVVAGLRAMDRKGALMSDSGVRAANPALYGAAVRFYGKFTAARKAAKIKLRQRADRRGTRSAR
jgi:hypothetical protein